MVGFAQNNEYHFEATPESIAEKAKKIVDGLNGKPAEAGSFIPQTDLLKALDDVKLEANPHGSGLNRFTIKADSLSGLKDSTITVKHGETQYTLNKDGFHSVGENGNLTKFDGVGEEKFLEELKTAAKSQVQRHHEAGGFRSWGKFAMDSINPVRAFREIKYTALKDTAGKFKVGGAAVGAVVSGGMLFNDIGNMMSSNPEDREKVSMVGMGLKAAALVGSVALARSGAPKGLAI